MARATARQSHVVWDGDVEPLASWRDRIEELMSPRTARLVAGVVAVAALVGVALYARNAPARIAPPAVPPVAHASASPATVLVHVGGEVSAPGLYELPAGARVADALAAAGGPTAKADLDSVNLAELLVDGAKVVLARRGAAPVPPPGALPSAAPGPVDLNRATQAELEAIPGIGPVKAAAIVARREAAGPFMALEDLLEVDGIGPATLEAIRPYVTL